MELYRILTTVCAPETIGKATLLASVSPEAMTTGTVTRTHTFTSVQARWMTDCCMVWQLSRNIKATTNEDILIYSWHDQLCNNLWKIQKWISDITLSMPQTPHMHNFEYIPQVCYWYYLHICMRITFITVGSIPPIMTSALIPSSTSPMIAADITLTYNIWHC